MVQQDNRGYRKIEELENSPTEASRTKKSETEKSQTRKLATTCNQLAPNFPPILTDLPKTCHYLKQTCHSLQQTVVTSLSPVCKFVTSGGKFFGQFVESFLQVVASLL